MIRWADTVDHGRWADTWGARWSRPRAAVGDRHVRAATVVVDHRADPARLLRKLPPPDPGGRLILALTVHRWALETGSDWLALLNDRDLTPELPHLCQPVPGQPSFTSEWHSRHAAVSDDGFSTVGLLLARRLDDATLRRATFTVVERPARVGLHFAVPPGLPLPLPIRGSKLSAGDIAAAFGLRLTDCRVLIDELVWSGALSLRRGYREPVGQGLRVWPRKQLRS